MELQKTAMQQLLGELDLKISKLIESNASANNTVVNRLEEVHLMILKHLPIEKKQIINTFKDAQVCHAMQNKMRGEQYFHIKFKKEIEAL